MDPHKPFYKAVLDQLLAKGELRRDGSVLVACGEGLDREVLAELEFKNAVISNLSEYGAADSMAPFRCVQADAENLPFADGSFDYTLVHGGLHHCRSPHRGLLEMYRVARSMAVVIEARDSLSMRLATRARLALDYELTCGPCTNFHSGGVRNSAIPNYVYRWTEREVRKTICSFAPEAKPRLRFFYGIDLYADYVALYSPARAWLLKRLAGPAAVLQKLLPRQGNRFAFAIRKPVFPEDLQPWLVLEGGQVAANRDFKL